MVVHSSLCQSSTVINLKVFLHLWSLSSCWRSCMKNVALRKWSADPEMPSSQITAWFHSSWQEARCLKRWLAEEKETCWTDAFFFIRCLFHITFQNYPRRDNMKHIQPWVRSQTLSWIDVSQIIHEQSDFPVLYRPECASEWSLTCFCVFFFQIVIVYCNSFIKF